MQHALGCSCISVAQSCLPVPLAELPTGSLLQHPSAPPAFPRGSDEACCLLPPLPCCMCHLGASLDVHEAERLNNTKGLVADGHGSCTHKHQHHVAYLVLADG